MKSYFHMCSMYAYKFLLLTCFLKNSYVKCSEYSWLWKKKHQLPVFHYPWLILIFLQRGNPLLKFVTNVPWEYDDIVPDYEIGKTICLLFLSVRYHNLNPDYINGRLKELGKKYELRVLLVQVIYFILKNT